MEIDAAMSKMVGFRGQKRSYINERKAKVGNLKPL